MSDLSATNILLDQEATEEQTLTELILQALGLIQTEAQQILAIGKQLADLQSQQANGILVMPSTIAAINKRLEDSVANIKKQSQAITDTITSVSKPQVGQPVVAAPKDNPETVATAPGEIPASTPFDDSEGEVKVP